MPQQQFPPHQDINTFLIHIHSADDQVVDQAAGEYFDQQQWLPLPRSPYFYGGDNSGVSYGPDNQYYSSPPNIDFTRAINDTPQLQEYHHLLVAPFLVPPPSSPIPIPNPRCPTTESSPFSSLSTSASTSSSASAATSSICRQAQPNFNEETQRWSCSGCNKPFSDKYGTERHINTVGLKVTCRYCGSRVSALESSRRRHFRRESCRRQAIQRGFTTRNEDDAFLEEPDPQRYGGLSTR